MKVISIIFMIFVGFGSIAHAGQENQALPNQNSKSSIFTTIKDYVSKVPAFIKAAGNHLFSTDGVKDIACAYALGMGLTAVHELGHAISAKILYGSPLDLTLGAMGKEGKPPIAQIGFVKLAGFNPATGHASIRYTLDQYHPLKSAAIYLAGPVCGALSSILAYMTQKKHDKLYLTKAAAMYGIFNHTLGVAGLSGIWLPGSDTDHFIKAIKEYRAAQ